MDFCETKLYRLPKGRAARMQVSTLAVTTGEIRSRCVASEIQCTKPHMEHDNWISTAVVFVFKLSRAL
jgi:hypothetical protein